VICGHVAAALVSSVVQYLRVCMQRSPAALVAISAPISGTEARLHISSEMTA